MIRLFLLGYKGYYLIKNLPGEYLPLIESVIIGRDANVENDYFEGIKSECSKKQLAFREREEKNDHGAGFYILVGWRWLITSMPDTQVIVFHDSLLPKYRGFNPLVTALINGDKKIGATCLLASSEYDTGEIIDQQSIGISYPMLIEEAIKLMSEVYLDLFQNLLKKITENSIVSTPQSNLDASYSLWRNEDDYFINWNWDADKIIRFIDAVGFPYAGARTTLQNETVIIRNAESEKDVNIENRDPGKVIFKKEQKITIVCGQGLLSIDEVFKANGEKIDLKNKFRIRFK